MGRPQGSQSLIVTTFRLPFTTHKKVKGDGNDGDAGDGDEVHGNGDDEQEGEAVGRTESRDEWARSNQSKMQNASETTMTTLMIRSLAHVVSSSGGRWVGWPGTGLKVMLFINIIKW